MIADENYGGYYEILDAIKDSGNTAAGAAGAETAVISFGDAARAAFNRTDKISYNGSGAEPGVSMLSVISAIVIVIFQITLSHLTTKDSGSFAINCETLFT